MIKRQLTIINKLGLHARAAAKFVATSGRFNCQIEVCKGDHCVDGKSIMAIMMLAASKGTVLDISADGGDELPALDALQALIDDYFEEGE